MLNILPTQPAEGILREKIAELERSKDFPLSGHSLMLGCLTARTKTGESRSLFAFSGALEGKFNYKGFVPPCFSENGFNEIVAEYDSRIHCYSDRIELGEKDLAPIRENLSNECLARLRENYTFYTPYGKKSFHDMGLENPPTGTGDCATIKLLSYCFKKEWEPVSLCEIYYGEESSKREHLHSYPPCDEKCALLLPHLFGLDILFSNDEYVIVNKEAGMLSVPGKGEDKADCVSSRVRRIFPSAPLLPSIHRLDMDTSGLLVLAKTERAKAMIGRQFENREVEKTYVALLDGLIKEEEGSIELPLRLDVEHRPLQIVDEAHGKAALTRWERVKVEIRDGRVMTRVRFFPKTGRTHQIRVHSACGLGHPIVGDRLYGTRQEGERLCLHAESLSFNDPATGERVSFSSPAPF